MKIRGSKITCLLLLFILKLVASCTPESCTGETTSFVNISFYKKESNKLTAPDSVTVFGAGRDTLKIYSNAANLTSIKLPLDASSGSCDFVLKINGTKDSLKFFYTTYPHLISKECGITFFYKLDSLYSGSSAIDTVLIKNKNITTFNEENIRIIYY
jgi:hypothetical protein